MSNATHQSHYLSVLAQTPPVQLKEFTEEILAKLDAEKVDVQVLQNRTGLVMLPYTDSVQGTPFHLGEVLMSEAYVRVHTQEGYGACLGRDLEQSLAIAILDAVMQTPPQPSPTSGKEKAAPALMSGETGRGFAALHSTIRDFVTAQAQAQQDADADLLRKVEATRVEMEIF